MRKHTREETNISVVAGEDLVEEPEEEEGELEFKERDESEEEKTGGASIGEMLDVMGGDAPHAKVPNQRNLTSAEGSWRVSVTREEET